MCVCVCVPLLSQPRQCRSARLPPQVLAATLHLSNLEFEPSAADGGGGGCTLAKGSAEAAAGRVADCLVWPPHDMDFNRTRWP